MHDTDNRFTKGLRNGLVASLLAWAAILLLTTAPRAQTACSYTAGSQTISAAFGVCGTAKQNADADLTSLAAAASTNALYYRSAANTWGPVTVGANLTFSGGTLAGGGDSIRVEDGTDAGTFTASTDADFEDSGNIDFVRTAGPPDQVKANLRTTTVGAATWGSGSSIAWGFDAGATDPQLTFGGNGSVSVGTTGAAAGWLVLADQGALSFSEEVANGSNILSFVPPAAITSNVNCNLVDGAAMIPDSCVGDGSDDDIPEAGDYTNLTATSPITQSGGVISTSIATNRLVGRTTAAAGVMEQITPDATLNLAAGALGVVDVTCTGCLGATEIAALDAGDVTTGALAVARGGTGAAPAGDDQVNISTGVAGATWLTLPDSDAVGTILGYDVTTNTWSTKADDDVPEVGDLAAIVGGTGITNTAGTIDLAPTEVNSMTWGNGSFTTETFDAGATDPSFTYSSPATAHMTGAGTSPIFALDDAASLRILEEDAGGSNYFELKGPATLGANLTCTIDAASGRIPDSCVGNGTDDSSAISDADYGDITVSAFGSVWTVDPDAVALGTDTTGNYVAGVTGGAGLVSSGTPAEAWSPSLAFAANELGGLTGASSWNNDVDTAFTWAFASGAVDPQLAFGSGTITMATVSGASPVFALDDAAALRILEEDAGGANFFALVGPATLGADFTCTIDATTGRIPDSCIGDGTDAAGGAPPDADYGDITVTAGVWAIDPNSAVLGTDTVGNYAAGDAEAGAALTGDTATAFFTLGALEVARGGTGAAPAGDDQVLVSSSVSAAAWGTLPDSDAVGTILGYDVTTNTWSTKVDDDVPEVGDFGALAATAPITQSGGTISTSMATASIIGRNTAGTGVMEVLAPATVKGILTYLQNAEIDTSAELRTIMTDDVGTGALMFGLISTMNDDLACTGSQVVRRNAGDTAFECATAAGTGDVVGPASATDNAIARFDTTTGKLIQNSAASVDDAGAIRSATNSGANVVSVPLTNWLMLTADYALNNVGTEQKAFNTTTNGRLTLPTGVYRFDVSMSVTGMSATTGNMKFDIIGAGTAVGDRFGWTSYGGDTGTASTAAAISGALQATQESAGNLVGAATATAHWVSLTGMFRVSTGGTVIPSITLTTASAATMKAGSWISIEKIGETGETTVGAWD